MCQGARGRKSFYFAAFFALYASAYACTAEHASLKSVLSAAASAIARNNPGALFDTIDRRSRDAMHSIVADRQKARALIEAHYPAQEKNAAIRALGDAANATSASALFRIRCAKDCRDWFRDNIAAPDAISEIDANGNAVVRTILDTTVVVRQGDPESGDWGIVWHFEELNEERLRANRELRLIEENAAHFERVRQLNSPATNGQPAAGSSR